uniref:Uncharacterized protein n=1 Tax=Arundo donax TaxID=35708 RepID=A0A0A9FHB0_ARUDO
MVINHSLSFIIFPTATIYIHSSSSMSAG